MTRSLSYLFPLLVAVILSGCPQRSDSIHVTNDATIAAAQSQNRSEPVFYNGRTYQLDLRPESNGRFALKVSPMMNTQEKDAVAVATSSVGYFACPDGKAGKLVGSPQFSGRTWKMTATCG